MVAVPDIIAFGIGIVMPDLVPIKAAAIRAEYFVREYAIITDFSTIRGLFSKFFLHHIENLRLNDRFMRVFHQILRHCAVVLADFLNLASAIGHDILYKSFRTPKRHQKTGEQYFIGIARHNAPHDMEYPAGEAVRVAVNVWLDDICDADELKTRLQTLVADRSGDWWVIALPEYGADVVDSLSLLP